MRIAVSGASGFLGRHVVPALADGGAELVLLRHHADIGTTPPGASEVALDMAEAPPPDLFDRLGRPDSLVHLAWAGLPHYGSPHHLEQELPRQVRFLEACLHGGLGHVVVAGTCLEYGMQEGALDETQPAHPVTAYGQAKLALLQRLEGLRARLGFGMAWARLFYLYGAGQAPTSLFSQLHGAIDRGDTHLPMSPGDQQRDFLPVADAAAAIARLALRRVDAGVVNVCSGRPMEVRDLARQWRDARASALVLDTGRFAYPSYEPFAFWGDRTRLDRLLEAS